MTRSPHCQYETRMGGYRALRQELAWFVYEWINPSTGATILEEFVGKMAPGGADGKLARRLLLRKDVTYDEFEVVAQVRTRDDGGSGRALVRVRAQSTGKEYDMVAPKQSEWMEGGAKFVGRIHPRGDGTYAVCGVLTRPGEWDEYKDVAQVADALATGAITSKSLQIAKALVNTQSESRTGPGRSESITDIARRFENIHSGSQSGTFYGMGPDEARSFVDRMDKEKNALATATNTAIRINSEIKPILDSYPKHLLEMMCHELPVKSLPYKDMMVERIAADLPGMVCDILYRMSWGEQSAFAHVLHEGFLPYPACMEELARRSADLEWDEDPDDPEQARGFLDVYTRYGLLVVGIAEVGGRVQKIVTVATDIKRRVLEYPGWAEYAESDGRNRTVESNFDKD